jgi:hypothetical protein
MRRRRPIRLLIAAVVLALVLVGLAHPPVLAGDVFGNVGPASQLSGEGMIDRFPHGHYSLDQHFTAVEASLTGGVDVSGVPPMIAYFLANVLWELTAFLARTVISLFTFAFSLDLLTGSAQTGGAGALGPVSEAIHVIYAQVLGQAWLVVSVTVVGMWAMWRAIVQRRYAQTAGTLAVSLIYLIVALAFVSQPARTVGEASKWTNEMSESFLSIAAIGSPGNGEDAKQAGADQLFTLLVAHPWSVLQFGGTEHCVKDGTGSDDKDPESVAVRPLSPNPGRDATLWKQLKARDEVRADGKSCVNNVRKYSDHFLKHQTGSDERDDVYEALNSGDSSKLPESDDEDDELRLGIVDKPATDAMEEGGQYQRLLIAIVVFVGELGAFLLIGGLSVGVILAQVLLLLVLAFAPVALVLAVIPGRGHDFFLGWLTRLAGLLVRKAAYSLVLAILLAVNAALASATSQLGWLMSFGLQGVFFWTVLIQRRQLTDRILGATTGGESSGDKSPGRIVHVWNVRSGARSVGRAARSVHDRLRGKGTS